MPKKFQCLRGVNDIFGRQYDCFEKIKEVVNKNATIYGFTGIKTPVIEDSNVFDIVNSNAIDKDICTFKSKNKKTLSLRAEGKAPIMRAYIEHDFCSKSQPIKFFYFESFFGYSKEDSNNYLQSWEFGFDILGKESPIVDAQIIIVICNILHELGIKKTSIKINHLGCNKCHDRFKTAFKNHIKKEFSDLCNDCREKIKKNPLQIINCDKCNVIEGSPQVVDYLCKDCREYFQKTLEFLEETGISCDLDPFLVHKANNYTGIAYKFIFNEDSSLEIGSGGRYNKLSLVMGAEEEIPATGAIVSIEKVIDIIKRKKISTTENPPSVFVAQLGDMAKKKAIKLFEDIKKAGISVRESFGRDSLKSQISRADRIGAQITIIIGKEEAVENRVIIREMDSGCQEKVDAKDAIKEIRKRLKKIRG